MYKHIGRMVSSGVRSGQNTRK